MRELKLDQTITDRALDSTSKYLTEVGKIPLLTIEEEEKLARKVKEGDAAAVDIMVRTNLRFVVAVAKKYQHRGLSLGDLINEGNLGLIRAAHRFDSTKGFRFISFAVWWIRQAILLALAEQTRVVRLPLSIVSSVTKLNKTIATLEQRLERMPTDREVADFLQLQEKRVTEHLGSARRAVSMDGVLNYDTGSSLLDVLADKSPATDHLIKIASGHAEVDRMLQRLLPREEKIIRMYFGLSGHEPMCLEEIANRCNMSKERVRQLKFNGIQKLRSRINQQICHTII